MKSYQDPEQRVVEHLSEPLRQNACCTGALPANSPISVEERAGSAGGKKFRLRSFLSLVMVIGWIVPSPAVFGDADSAATNSFADLSLEELMNISVTSVSKKETKLVDAAAAVAVLTSEDIRRLGATSIPEALRAIPGMNVARINANEWAISARGFNSQYARQLLVLVDGRTVYTPSFSGVFWHGHDLMLEDLDRIEVIRGPGATLWGANAVNGVINIISKSARDTQGFLGNVSYGTDLQPLANIRYSGQLASNLHYRVYTQYLNHDGFEQRNGQSAHDAWWTGRTGIRFDWEPSEQNLFTLQGDYNRQRVQELFEYPQLTPPVGNQVQRGTDWNYGGNVLGRWTHIFGADSESSLQFYYDTFKHQRAASEEQRDTFDVDWHHRFGLGQRQDIVWGLGYRYSPDRIDFDPQVVSFSPRRADNQLFSGFVQDEIQIVEDRLHLTLGSKFEHNDYTGFEIQPSGRLLWNPTEHQAVWGAVSRATRTPNRFEDGGRYNLSATQPPASPPVLISAIPGDDLKSEELLAYEAGYRIEPLTGFSLDVAAFYNEYDRLVNYQQGAMQFEPNPPPGHVLVPLEGEFSLSGQTYGVEVQAQWQSTDWWRLTAGYTWLRMNASESVEQDNPEHQLHLRSYVDILDKLEFNTALYFVETTSHSAGITAVSTPGYLRLDLGLTWRPTDSLELALWGQNLLDSQHSEFFSYHSSVVTEIPRGVYGKLTVKF